jgi:hypothetical protein
LKTQDRRKIRELPKGCVIIKTAQPLGRLTVWLSCLIMVEAASACEAEPLRHRIAEAEACRQKNAGRRMFGTSATE